MSSESPFIICLFSCFLILFTGPKSNWFTCPIPVVFSICSILSEKSNAIPPVTAPAAATAL